MIRTKQQRVLEATAVIVMSIVAFLILYPFLLLFMSSITDEKTLLIEGNSLLPKKLSLDAYAYIWNSKDTIFRAYAVTIGITAVGTVTHVLITSMAAYTLSIDELPGKKVFTALFLFPMLFDGGMVSTYMVYTTMLHIKNSYMALLMPNLLFGVINCIIMRTYLRTNIPREIYESARIDGASEFSAFFRIALPLAKPIIATISIFAGLGYWNDWMNGLLYVTDTTKFSIQQVLNMMISNIQYLTQFAGSGMIVTDIPSVSVRMAIAFVAFLPILILYPFLQQYFRTGITLGAVKG